MAKQDFNTVTKYILLTTLMGLVISAISLIFSFQTQAQSADSDWSMPVNLSNSGSGSLPKMVVDSDGKVHIYWIDALDGLTYTTRDESGAWEIPDQIQAPFADSLENVTFIPDAEGYIHAFWIDRNDFLVYSRTTSNAARLTWNLSQIVAGSALDFHYVLNNKQNIYLTYSSSLDPEPGVYFRSLDDTGVWSNPLLMYTSPFFRNITTTDTSVSTAVVRDGRVIITWEDGYREKVFTAWSDDGGRTWSEPGVVDQREERDGPESVGPSKSRIHIQDGEVVLLWQAGHDGAVCDQYSASLPSNIQSSSRTQDGYLKLDLSRNSLSDNFQVCPEDLHFLQDEAGGNWLFSRSNTGYQISSWFGSVISPLQPQNELSGFTHPTTYRRVDLDCQQAAIQDNRFLVVGCDREIAGDIWFMERPLGSVVSWFPTPTPEPLWSAPDLITSNNIDKSSSPVLLSSPGGRQHAVWTGKGGGIFYTFFDGSRWEEPVQVLTSPGEQVGNLSAVRDRDGNIFAAWDVPQNDVIYYSQVPEAEAVNRNTWTSPQAVPVTYGGRSPHVDIDQYGRIVVAFAVPFNEGRGVYTIKAEDIIQGGQPIKWDSPELIFNASENGWSMVDKPQIGLGHEGNIVIIWTRYTSPPESQASGLYISKTINGVRSEPEEVVQGNIIESQIIAGSDDSMHLAWVEQDAGDRATIWHQFSPDQGIHWSEKGRISGFSNGDVQARLIQDASNTLHMVVVSQSGFISFDGNSSLMLQNWVFDGTEWISDERLTLDSLENPANLSVNITLDGSLEVLLLAEMTSEFDSQENDYGLYFSQRPLNLPDTLPTPLPTFTPQPALQGLESTQEPTPTPKLEFPAKSENQSLPIFNNRLTLLIISGIPAALIVIWAFIYGLRKLRNRHR